MKNRLIRLERLRKTKVPLTAWHLEVDNHL